jgi:hypothetical protein
MKYQIKIGGLEMDGFNIHEADNMKGIIQRLIFHISMTSGDTVEIEGLEDMWKAKSKFCGKHHPLEGEVE